MTPSTSQMKIIASTMSESWLIRPDARSAFALSAMEISERSENKAMTEDEYLSQYYTLRQPAFIDGDGIAHIEVRGALLNQGPKIYERVGIATFYSTIIAETQAAVKQGSKAIMYHVDSPGGTVAGVQEAGQAIIDCGVPTVAYCSGLSCSAAYWLSAGCTGIVATPSATVGNIGAILSWADADEFWKKIGVTFKALTSEGADLKSTFHLEPNESQLAFLQESINDAGESFRQHVAAGREAASASLDDEVWRAGWYSGHRAEALGLVDAIGSESEAADFLKSLVS